MKGSLDPFCGANDQVGVVSCANISENYGLSKEVWESRENLKFVTKVYRCQKFKYPSGTNQHQK